MELAGGLHNCLQLKIHNNDRVFAKIFVVQFTGGSTCKSGWSQNYLDLQKMAYIHLQYIYIYIYIYVKLIYCDYPNKNE